MLSALERSEALLNAHLRTIGLGIAFVGLVWRIHYASDYYLDADEALHYLVAMHPWHGLAEFYRNATRVAHPPLFIPILQATLLFGRSEQVLRSVPMMAGVLFPWFVMLWVRDLAGNAAALSAQLFLTFSPTLADLSTEVRAYTLAFLFFAISLLLLEKALDRASVGYMAGFHAFLYLAILTEYSVAWFTAAVGIYTLLRLCKDSRPSAIRITWVFGQLGALGLYIFLYLTQVSRSHDVLSGMYSTWLASSFPQPHEQILLFALKGSLRQFYYAFQRSVYAWFGAGAFLIGLYRVYRNKSPLHSMLLVLPFCVACLGAILHLFPYGSSRHTAILSIAIAAGVGAGVAAVSRNRILPVLVVALPVVLLWNWRATDQYIPVPRDRHHVSAMRDAIQFIRSNVPSESVVVTDAGTSHILGYYLDCPDYGYYDSDEPYRIRQCAGLRIVVAPTFQFSGFEELRDTLLQVQTRYHPQAPFWVAVGGFGINVSSSTSDSRPFGRTMSVFQTSDLTAAQRGQI